MAKKRRPKKRRPKKRKPKNRRPKKRKSTVTYRNKRKAGKEFFLNYFLIHNLFSIFIFFFLALYHDLYEMQSNSWEDIFRWSFLEFAGGVFILSLISSGLGRLFGYMFLYIIYWGLKTTPLGLWEVQKDGKSRMDLSFLVRTLIGAVVFSCAFYTTMQYAIFEERNFSTFLLAYMIIQIGIFIIVFIKYK